MSQPTTAQTANATNAKTAYIIDNLYIFMRSGASKNYRLLGSVNAGSQLTLLSAEENGYIKVRDDKGREGWVETKFVTTTPGLQQQNTALNTQVNALKERLHQAQIKQPKLQELNKTLNVKNEQLSDDITRLEATLKQERAEKQQATRKEKQLLLTYGSAIAFFGLFVGIILTILLSRRKQNTGWA